MSKLIEMVEWYIPSWIKLINPTDFVSFLKKSELKFNELGWN
jgi:hypothetical protein